MWGGGWVGCSDAQYPLAAANAAGAGAHGLEDRAAVDAFLLAIDRAAILETVRTGTSGIGRGERILRV